MPEYYHHYIYDIYMYDIYTCAIMTYIKKETKL